MEQLDAVASFSALGQQTRLDVFRLLVRAGRGGLAAGSVAKRLGIPANTLSSHLAVLQSAGLLTQRRDGRSIIYTADMAALHNLLGWLVQDCCGGGPDECAPLLDLIATPSREIIMPHPPLYVLFLCTGNSARSILAEAILNREGQGRFIAYSAGSRPKGEPHPLALQLLEREGYDTGFARSKSWDEFAAPGAPKLDFVFTVCDNAAAEECPFWPGQPVSAHWGVPDPAAAEGNEAERGLAFAEAYRMLRNRILAFTALPIGTLDVLTLQSRLHDIGQSGDA